MRFADKQLLLTGEAATLATANGEECLIAALLLLFRICRSVTVALPPGTEDLDRRCRAPARAVEFGRSITFTTDPDLSRSEEHTSELQSLMRISYAVFCLKKHNKTHRSLRSTSNDI